MLWGANQKLGISTAAFYQQVASPFSQATRGTGLDSINLANQKFVQLTYCGPGMSGSRAALPGHSPRGTLVPIETAIKRCHHLRFCGVDSRVGGSVTEALYRIMACKSRNYALEKSAQRQFATHVVVHNRHEANRRTRIFACRGCTCITP
jgi:hypothetical protein